MTAADKTELLKKPKHCGQRGRRFTLSDSVA